MKKTAIFFGPEKGAVNRVADMIRNLIGPEKVDLVPVKNASPADFASYDQIIFGISTVGKETWDGKPASSDWGKFLPQVRQGDFKGKTVAMYGLGDHITYASSFVDFMGLLARQLIKTEARIVGQVPVDEYEFEESAAIFDGKFIGLPLDEDFEPELTDDRIARWLQQIKGEFGF